MADNEINNNPQSLGNSNGSANPQDLNFLSEEELLSLYGGVVEGAKPILLAKGCGGCCGANGCYGK